MEITNEIKITVTENQNSLSTTIQSCNEGRTTTRRHGERTGKSESGVQGNRVGRVLGCNNGA